MSNWVILSIGFLAQILFSSRFIIQLIQSEKAKKSESPLLFWQLSLLASFLLFTYGWLQNDFSIMLGQVLTYFIYIRNIQLQGKWTDFPIELRYFLLVFPFIIVIYGYNNNTQDIDQLFNNEAIPFWLLILGSVGQVIFTLRFVYQWIYSEKKKESVMPLGFWLISILGSGIILSYAILKPDIVLLFGHLFGSIVYIRNIMLIAKASKTNKN